MTHTFIGCDWGTTSFRLRLVERGTRRVIAAQIETAGVKTFAALAAGERAARMVRFLTEQIAALPGIEPDAPVVVTGMASSSVGWRELPYAEVAFPLDASAAVVSPFTLPGETGVVRRGLLVSGVRTVGSDRRCGSGAFDQAGRGDRRGPGATAEPA